MDKYIDFWFTNWVCVKMSVQSVLFNCVFNKKDLRRILILIVKVKAVVEIVFRNSSFKGTKESHHWQITLGTFGVCFCHPSSSLWQFDSPLFLNIRAFFLWPLFFTFNFILMASIHQIIATNTDKCESRSPNASSSIVSRDVPLCDECSPVRTITGNKCQEVSGK